MKKNLYNSYAL